MPRFLGIASSAVQYTLPPPLLVRARQVSVSDRVDLDDPRVPRLLASSCANRSVFWYATELSRRAGNTYTPSVSHRHHDAALLPRFGREKGRQEEVGGTE
jgi:hypothetical protein